MKVWPVEITKQIYLLITLVITLPMLWFAYTDARANRTIHIQAKQLQLTEAGNMLAGSLAKPVRQLTRDSRSRGMEPQALFTQLNETLPPLLDGAASAAPHLMLGYCARGLGLVASHPRKPELLGKPPCQESLPFYERQTPGIIFLDMDQPTWEDQPVMIAIYPVIDNDEVIGHFLVSANLSDINTDFYKSLLRSVLIALLIWLAVLLTIRKSFQSLDKALRILAERILREDPPCLETKFPQLRPLIVTIHDLRARLLSEHEEKMRFEREMTRLDRLNLVGQMAAGVAHEIRNPLTVVGGYLQMLRSGSDGKAKERFDLVLEELGRVNSIIEDFLALARDREIKKQPCQLNDLIGCLYPLLYTDAIKYGIDVDLRLDERLPLICADAKEIKQLVLNLSRNAIEAMHAHGRLTIRTSHRDHTVRLHIADTGCGMDAITMEKIFDPFYTTKADGTGLGLAVCRSIVDRHDGRISIVSKQGAGTSITILFPPQTA